MGRPTGMSTKGHESKARAVLDEKVTSPEDMLLLEVPPHNPALNEDGQFWWMYYCGLFIESKKLSRYFIPHIHIYCMTLQTIDAFEKNLSETGHLIDVPKVFKGEEYIEEIPNPILKELAKLYDQLDRLGNSLGTTPYSSQVQGMETGGGLNDPVSSGPPSIPNELLPETIKFAKAE